MNAFKKEVHQFPLLYPIFLILGIILFFNKVSYIIYYELGPYARRWSNVCLAILKPVIEVGLLDIVAGGTGPETGMGSIHGRLLALYFRRLQPASRGQHLSRLLHCTARLGRHPRLLLDCLLLLEPVLDAVVQ